MKKIIPFIASLLIFEFSCFLIIRVFKLSSPPKSYTSQFLPFFVDINETFGVWHYSNITTRHFGPCWNVEYKFNSYGARDIERSKTSSNKRIIFLGDSFIEGYGIDANDRLSNLTERKSGIESLNFGTSGSFGTTQMRLLYESLAKDFDHDLVVVSFFPFNDFADDDLELSREFIYTKNRYRPYLVKDSVESAYKLTYEIPKLENSEAYYKNFSPTSKTDLLRHIKQEPNKNVFEKGIQTLVYFTYSGTLIDFIYKRLKEITKAAAPPHESKILTEIDQVHLDRFLYNISELKKQAEVPILILMIGHPLDIAEFQKTNQNPLGDQLSAYCLENDIALLDLISPFAKEDYTSLFLPCDGHWSKKGNNLVHKLFEEKLEEIMIFD